MPLELELALRAIALAGAAFLAWQNAWRAVLFFDPRSIRIEVDDPPDQLEVPTYAASLHSELLRLGFTPLGSRLEHPRLRAPITCLEYARPEEHIFATVHPARGGKGRAFFLTPLPGEGFVITANYRRPAREEAGRYLSGGLEDASLERVYKAHRRRLEGLGPHGDFTPQGRVEAARAWYAGPGRVEVREQNLRGLLWTLGSVGIVAAALFGRS